MNELAREVRAPARSHPHYGTCGRCGLLKHVTPDGVLHDHNRYRARGTVVTAQRCPGSGERYLERTADDPRAPDLLAILQPRESQD
ncbi:hypothetical protein [Pseudonocardia sp. H11422]|uniref:hypothetical protein n=1 Tax=Pseudonocardia sp. H11422 TaxID=2835866 RepID=UPI001BDCF5E2|nr:hypothetical protein [Pseudonocardia sp. H11422]